MSNLHDIVVEFEFNTINRTHSVSLETTKTKKKFSMIVKKIIARPHTVCTKMTILNTTSIVDL